MSEMEEEIRASFVRGDLSSVEKLLETHDYLSSGDKGFTLVNKALILGRPQIALLLLRKVASTHCQETSMKNPLYHSVAGNHVEVVKQLLGMGASVNTCDEIGRTPLHKAVMVIQSKRDLENNYKIMDLLLNGGADVNATDNAGGTPLLYAVKLREPKVIQILVSYCTNINFVSPEGTQEFKGYTPLHCAIQCQKLDIVDLLLQNGADVNIQTPDNETPFFLALDKVYPRIVKILLKWGADVNGVSTSGELNGFTPLQRAILGKKEYDGNVPFNTTSFNKMKLITMLLKTGALVNAKGKNNLTACHVALNDNRADVFELLLKYGADLNSLNKKSMLRFAVGNGRTKIVRHILKYCRNLITECNSGILRVALLNNDDDSYIIVRELLEYGFTANKFERSEMMFLAITERCDYTLEELLKHRYGANKLYTLKEKMCFNLKPLCGNDNRCFLGSEQILSNIAKSLISLCDSFMPLHMAVKLNLVSKARLLIRYGADVNLRDNEGKTPILYVGENLSDFTEIVKLLVQNRSNVTDTFKLFLFAMRKLDTHFMAFLLDLVPCMIKCVDSEGYTALHHAIIDYLHLINIDKIKLAVEKGDDMDSKTEICTGLKVIRFLLGTGVDVNSKPSESVRGVLHFVAQAEPHRLELLEALLKYKADVNMTCNGVTPLHVSVYKRNVPFCRLFLARGANVNAKMNNGQTALHVAASSCFQEQPDLIRVCARPAERHPRRFIFEMRKLTQFCDREILDTLVNFGADIHAKDNFGNTPFHFAAQNDSSGPLLIALLADYGAQIPRDIIFKAVQNCVDLTPIHDNLQALVFLGADIDCRDRHGCTPLHWSAKHGSKFSFNFLNLGADINALNDENLTPFEEVLKAVVKSDHISRNIHGNMILLFRQHVIKLRAAGLFVSRKNMIALDDYWDNEFYDKCKCELNAMKNKKIDGFENISYYDILMSDWKKLVNFASSEGLASALKVWNIRQWFPNYAYRLELQRALLKQAPRKAVLLEKSRDVFSSCISRLPDLCLAEVFKYLHDDDLKNMVHARYPQQEFQKLTYLMWPKQLFEKSSGDDSSDLELMNTSYRFDKTI